MFNKKEIIENTVISEVIGKELLILRRGMECITICPFHEDTKPSLTINDQKGLYCCFACGAKGNVIDFTMRYHSIGFYDACTLLSGYDRPLHKTNIQYEESYDTLVQENTSEASQIMCGEVVQLWNHKQKKISYLTPEMVFPYHSPNGELIGYVLRANINGQKWTPTVRYMSHDSIPMWTIAPFQDPRPLYNLHLLNSFPDKQVLIGEGEKTADALSRLMRTVSVTWNGGSKSVHKTDWWPLQGRDVVIIGDADSTGEKAAKEVAECCKNVDAGRIRIVAWDKSKPKGWDAADAEKEKMSRGEFMDWAKKFMYEV